VDDDSSKLFRELRKVGFSSDAIEAAWPSWWSDDIAASPSSRAELRFALARKLGLAPKPLLGERVEFVWKDRARFKHLTTQDAVQQNILSSFGVAIGRLLLRGVPVGHGFANLSPLELRESILNHSRYVDLQQLLATCWALGVPVIQLRVFPLATHQCTRWSLSPGGVTRFCLAEMQAILRQQPLPWPMRSAISPLVIYGVHWR
jgi:hypothetical protein